MNEFEKIYKDQYSYEVKRGQIAGKGEVITNENAGLYLIAFDEQAPWATHRKYQVFDEKYSEIFGRPVVDADRIVMCHEIMKVIEAHTNDIKNALFGKYVLTKYLLLFMVRKVLETESFGEAILKAPAKYVQDQSNRKIFSECISDIVSDLIVDLNGEIDDLGADFDYRGKLRDSDWVKKIEKDVVGMHEKTVKRGKFPSLEAQWNEKSKAVKPKAA
jgi:hypothetical protein